MRLPFRFIRYAPRRLEVRSVMGGLSLSYGSPEPMIRGAGLLARQVTGLAAGVGFEPTSHDGLPGSEPGPIDHSGNPPLNPIPPSERNLFVDVEGWTLDPPIEDLAVLLHRGNLSLIFQSLERRMNDGKSVLVFVERELPSTKMGADVRWSPGGPLAVLKHLSDGIRDADRLFFGVFPTSTLKLRTVLRSFSQRARTSLSRSSIRVSSFRSSSI